MTSVHDIPYEDIKIFLKANKKTFDDKDDAYKKTLILLKDKKAKGHTIKIIEWMIAHNLLIRKIDIPHYTTRKIDKMSSFDIDILAKLLTMKGNNRENIKNILRYLHKLDKLDILLPGNIPRDVIFADTIIVMELIDFYEDYPYASSLTQYLQVNHKLGFDLDQIIYPNNELNILFQIGEDEDNFIEITAYSNEGFTAGKILFEFTKYVDKHIRRRDVFDTFDGLIYITAILWNKDYNGYEIMFR
jgi:hypothetical protein